MTNNYTTAEIIAQLVGAAGQVIATGRNDAADDLEHLCADYADQPKILFALSMIAAHYVEGLAAASGYDRSESRPRDQRDGLMNALALAMAILATPVLATRARPRNSEIQKGDPR